MSNDEVEPNVISSMKLYDIPILCLNMKQSIDRKNRMNERFQLKGLSKNVTFVEAVEAESSLVDYYLANLSIEDVKEIYSSNSQGRKDAACFATHMKAIRTFLEMVDKNGCIICEDDILFHNDFETMYSEVMANLPENAPLISFAWMISDSIDQTFVGINPEKNNLWNIDPDVTWGAQCYYINTGYALNVLMHLDQSFITLMEEHERNKMTSEIIIQLSDGYMVSHPLVIEDCIDSDRAPQDIPFHVRHWCHWNYDNYLQSDPNRFSPLKEIPPTEGWDDYPFCIETDESYEISDTDYDSNTSDGEGNYDELR